MDKRKISTKRKKRKTQPSKPKNESAKSQRQVQPETQRTELAKTNVAEPTDQLASTTSDPAERGTAILESIPAERYAEHHAERYAGSALGFMLSLPPKVGIETGRLIVRDVVDGVGPRDPLERMLVEQLVFCHERARRLAGLATDCSHLQDALAAHAQCDKAMNSYRRGLLALREYRSRGRPAPGLTVQQVNQAENQNVTVAVAAPLNAKT